MSLPVFLYYIVLEKETRLIETMKINGMRMNNYWMINFIFSMILYIIQATVFMIFGAVFFNIEAFFGTSLTIWVAVLLGWGLA